MLQPCSFKYNNKDIIYILDDIYFMDDDGVKVLNDCGMKMVLDCSNEFLERFFKDNNYDSKTFYEWGWKYKRIMLSDFCFPDIREITACIVRNYFREMYPDMDEDLFLIRHNEDIENISYEYIKNKDNLYMPEIEEKLLNDEVIASDYYCKFGISYADKRKMRGKTY